MCEVKNIITVGSAMLTPECIETLETLQEDSNYMIDEMLKALLTANVLLTTPPENIGSKMEARKKDILLHLPDILEYLECLKSPAKKG